MPPAGTKSPARTGAVTHLKRAFSWNLGRIAPSASESQALGAAGVTDPVVARYAVWRRSLLLVALGPTLAALLLALLDALEGGMGELSGASMGLELAWFLAMSVLVAACFLGVRGWRRPGTASTLLVLAWVGVLLIPLLYGLLPADARYDMPATSGAALPLDGADRLDALQEIAAELALSSGALLLLLPTVLSLFPGAVNGCLRIKSLLPAAPLPGWLLVCGSPAFLLCWLVPLSVVNQVAQSPLLVVGFVLWAGAPIWYALRGRLFVGSRISAEDARRIGGVKRVVTAISLAGIGLILASAFTTKVAGLTMLGTDPEAAVSTRLDEVSDGAHALSGDDVVQALDDATSFLYVYDLSSWQLLVDFLAKLLLATAVFSDLVLRAMLAAWRNDRSSREPSEAAGHDASAAAAVAALSSPP